MTLNTILETLPGPLQVALFFSAFYFIAALLTGVWEWRAMLNSEDGQAHKYIDIAHHAALHYGLFILLVRGRPRFALALGKHFPGLDTR
ncbi:MAG: hypothetical protein COA91_06915 [Robiginitomaculum sp.]|nr:MAG: hypothetical protein COA91_06915 [Robiginitomaculum sp.]